MIVYLRMFGFVAAAAAVVVLGGARAAASPKGDVTCASGSVASGIYSSLKIAGACAIDAGSNGSVTVTGNLTVLPAGSLVAVWGGAGNHPVSTNLTVGGNLDVQAGGLLNLGCEPVQYTCANDPGQSYSTNHTVGGNLTGENAFAVVIHHTAISGNVTLSGGGGGVNSCGLSVPALFGAPPYGDVEDVFIGGNLRITGWQSCWLGWFRDTVMHNVDLDSNVTGDPDGNEMANNIVLNNLSCTGNSPNPQTGDGMGGPTTVVGNATGQCVAGTGVVIH
jgi:hypothetical protein